MEHLTVFAIAGMITAGFWSGWWFGYVHKSKKMLRTMDSMNKLNGELLNDLCRAAFKIAELTKRNDGEEWKDK